jgi:hypothetical protein
MSDFSKYEYVEFKLKHLPSSGEMMQPKHSYNQSADNMTMSWVQTDPQYV